MNLLRAGTRAFLLTAFAGHAIGQEWTDEQLVAACPGFQVEEIGKRLEQIGQLLAARPACLPAMAVRIHGDHREYRLRIEGLLNDLADERWQVREAAERTLIEVGARAWTMIEQKKDAGDVLEQRIRCARVLEALVAKGDADEKRDLKLMRGLVTTALYCEPDERLLRSLRSALGHTDNGIGELAIRALGKLGGDAEANALLPMLTWKGGIHRMVTAAALGRMQGPRALAICRQLLDPKASAELLEGGKLDRTQAMAIVRALHSRSDDGAKALLQELQNHADPVIAGAAKVVVPHEAAPTEPARFALPDPGQIDGKMGGLFGDSQRIDGAFTGLPEAELSFAEVDSLEYPDHVVQPPTATRLFLSQGSLLIGELTGLDGDKIRLVSPRFGEIAVPRKDIQGVATDPSLTRLIGASVDHDRVKLRNNDIVDGTILGVAGGQLSLRKVDGAEQRLPLDEVAGLLFQRPQATEPDATTYSRLDLVTGERLLGFLADGSPSHVAISVPDIGVAVVKWTDVSRLEYSVGGGALWGFTLIADYSENRAYEVDEQGRMVFELNELFGTWDAECLDNGNLLITEFSLSRVQEINRKGETVWFYDEGLKNPYDADRLPNGNTLIADTFASRVIEVTPDKKIVWSYADEIRPFDCDRLPNGNTLIADALKERVIEVSPQGEIVWQVNGMPQPHDADRLPNGNTLITLRNKGAVIEIDRDGKVVWELNNLSSPCDADRLPNGNTLVAENIHVREFDRRGHEVWRKETTWAVEANRY